MVTNGNRIFRGSFSADAVRFALRILPEPVTGFVKMSPKPMDDEGGKFIRIPSVPNLIRREAVAVALSFVAVCLVSAIIDAPIQGPSDPQGIPTEGVKAPWIFVGIQQMLRYLPPVVAGIGLPLGVLAVIGLLPFGFSGTPAKQKAGIIMVLGIGLTATAVTLWGYLA